MSELKDNYYIGNLNYPVSNNILGPPCLGCNHHIAAHYENNWHSCWLCARDYLSPSCKSYQYIPGTLWITQATTQFPMPISRSIYGPLCICAHDPRAHRDYTMSAVTRTYCEALGCLCRTYVPIDPSLVVFKNPVQRARSSMFKLAGGIIATRSN